MRGRGKASATIRLGEAAFDVLANAGSAMTLRQLYYALVSIGALTKDTKATKGRYYNQLKRVIRDLREDGTIPWPWLVDHTRSVFQSRTWESVEGLLEDSARLYRRDLMRGQNVAIQLWAESDSIGSVIAQVADRYTAPTFIGRGYSARGYLWDAATDAVAAHEAGKRVEILHVGDYDPSGEGIFRDVEETLRSYSAAAQMPHFTVKWVRDNLTEREVSTDTAWLAFERLALTAAQVEEYALPAHELNAADPRILDFGGLGAVEVEALPVDILLGIVEDAILDRIDGTALRAVRMAEESERSIAKRIAATPVAKLLEAAS